LFALVLAVAVPAGVVSIAVTGRLELIAGRFSSGFDCRHGRGDDVHRQ
jgi:hypothetical protein